MGMSVLLSYSIYYFDPTHLSIRNRRTSEWGFFPSRRQVDSHVETTYYVHYELTITSLCTGLYLKMTHESPVRFSRNRKSRSRGLRTTTGWYVLL